MKILIVDDNPTNIFLLQEYLNPFGTFNVASNGEEAIERVRIALETNTPYDLICMDIHMPNMDGQEATQKIRNLEQTKGNYCAKIIMTTALNDFKNVSSAYKNLCDGYLVKPIRKDLFLQELKRLKLII